MNLNTLKAGVLILLFTAVAAQTLCTDTTQVAKNVKCPKCYDCASCTLGTPASCATQTDCAITCGSAPCGDGFTPLVIPQVDKIFAQVIIKGTFCYPCPDNCKSCTFTSATTLNCTSCNGNFATKTDGTCSTDSCIPGYYFDTTCKPCADANCAECNAQGVCTTCKPNYELKTGGVCQACPADGTKYFDATTSTCVGCPTGCSKCTSAYNCTQCIAGYKTISYENLRMLCVATCPSGYFTSGSNCQICQSPCTLR
eukprot:TRINITY_DN6879_c0_g1_i2.p1 TRINITY_DN6879_c0_g1~~TRINITY_DN6879_c0_g1_i2.p1  ORF type:complete len:255 (-),score=-6.89 TRINITY_DN6879_c0_g1_i2:84-848(-)